MRKNQLCKIGVVVGLCMAVSHYFMTAATVIFLGNVSIYDYLSEMGGEYMYINFWPQVILAGITFILVFSSAEANTVFIGSVFTSLAFSIEILNMAGDFKNEIDIIPSSLFLCAVGVLVMLAASFYLKNQYKTEALTAESAKDGIVDHIDNRKAYIEFVSGELSGAKLELSDMLVIGKNPKACNLILSNPKCSRVHCTIRYDKNKDIILLTLSFILASNPTNLITSLILSLVIPLYIRPIISKFFLPLRYIYISGLSTIAPTLRIALLKSVSIS